MRSVTYDRLIQTLHDDYPLESMASLRRILQGRAQAWADAYKEAKAAVTPERQKAMDAMTDKWQRDLERHAQDPDFTPQLTQVQLASNMTFGEEVPLHSFAQFCDHITATQSKYFMCRSRACRHFGPAWHWIMNSSMVPDEPLNAEETPHIMNTAFTANIKDFDQGQYKCPMCFLTHAPFKDKNDVNGDPWVKANHVMVLNYKDPVTKQATQSTFLCQWPDTISQNLEDGLKMIYNDLQQLCAAGNISEIMAKTVEIANRGAHRTMFERVEVKQAVLTNAFWTNESMQKPSAKKWKFGHLPHNERGRPCVDHAKYEYSDDTVILTQADVMLFIGYSTFLEHFEHVQHLSKL